MQSNNTSNESNLIVLFVRLMTATIQALWLPLSDIFKPLVYIFAPYLIGAGLVSITFLAIILYLKFLHFLKSLKEDSVYLEVVPSSTTLESQTSTEQLFRTFHSFTEHTSWLDKIAGNKKSFSMEIVSTASEGIRYIIKTTNQNATLIKKNLRSYLPSIEVNEVEDYLPESAQSVPGNWQFIEMKLGSHYAAPLMNQLKLSTYDPIAYITGHMTQLAPFDLVSMQLVLTPVYGDTHPKIAEDTSYISHGIKTGKDISPYLNRSSNLFKQAIKVSLKFLPKLVLFIVLTPLQLITWFFSNDKRVEMFPFRVFSILEESKRGFSQLSGDEQEFQISVGDKVQSNLYEVSLRFLVVSDESQEVNDRLRGLISSLASFDHDRQWFKIKKNSLINLLCLFPIVKNIFRSYRYTLLKHRLLSFTCNPVLSVAEVSALYHFPYTTTTETEDIVKNKTRCLPSPLSLKNNQELDVTFAENHYANRSTFIGLTLEERRRHMYIIGATGTGKSTLLLRMIYEDMENGKGLAVIDPHGDLSERLLGVVPEHRVEDIIYFNPYDIKHPVGLNLLELPKGLDLVELQREKDLIVSTVISIFHKLYTERFWGPKMEHVLRNTLLTALELENPTFMTVYTLLTDSKLRKSAVRTLKNSMLKSFWNQEFEKLTSGQKADTISPITNKLSIFLTTAMAQNIINQKTSTLDFDDILDNCKILICDLSKGKIGEDTSAFLGGLLVAKMQLAAYRRVHKKQSDRKDFFLYIDEFQNFATESFAQLLSEARKYRLNTILAHQTISQIEDKNLLKIILANAGTVIAFRTSNPSDESMILPLFSPQVQKSGIANLQSFTFYIKLQALKPEDVFTGTIADFTIPEDVEIKNKCIDQSRSKYAVYQEVQNSIPDNTLVKKLQLTKKNANAQMSILERIK